jgi:hypothetical protein
MHNHHKSAPFNVRSSNFLLAERSISLIGSTLSSSPGVRSPARIRRNLSIEQADRTRHSSRSCARTSDLKRDYAPLPFRRFAEKGREVLPRNLHKSSQLGIEQARLGMVPFPLLGSRVGATFLHRPTSVESSAGSVRGDQLIPQTICRQSTRGHFLIRS